VWQPEYDRDGQPFVGDESTLTPGGQLEAERRLIAGLGRGASRRQRRAAIRLLIGIGLLVGLFLAGLLLTALISAL
jgi:hypothetical protein